MKVVLLSNYGGRIPHEIIPFVSGDTGWRWGKIIPHIEKIAVPAEKPESSNANIVRYLGPEPSEKMYLFKSENITISIVEVDPRRKWTILKYDGAEYIQYLDYKIINECSGYCELPNK